MNPVEGRMRIDHYLCPGCGGEVPIGPAGCPRCPPPKPRKPKRQAEKRSWEQDKCYDDLDLPDEDFDYDEFVEREFGRKPHRQIGVPFHWWAIGLGLILLWTIVAALGWFLW